MLPQVPVETSKPYPAQEARQPEAPARVATRRSASCPGGQKNATKDPGEKEIRTPSRASSREEVGVQTIWMGCSYEVVSMMRRLSKRVPCEHPAFSYRRFRDALQGKLKI
jgi:hypothetical protein